MRYWLALLVVTSASTGLAAPLEVAQAFAEVPPHVRLAIDVEESAFPEVQLFSLRDIDALEGQGQRLAQASEAPTLSTVPAPRVSSFRDESRVFWFSAGASAVTSLAARVLLIIPAWIGVAFAQAASAALLGPVASFILVLGIVGAYTVGESAAAALVSGLVFDNSSRFYTSSFLPTFAGHLAGNAIAAGVLWLSVGFGGMLLYGLDAISAFTTGTAVGAVTVFSILGAMPVFVVAFLASVALPAVLGTWALAATARPREGFVIDPTWRPAAGGRRSSVERALPEDRERVPLRTLVTVAIPGT